MKLQSRVRSRAMARFSWLLSLFFIPSTVLAKDVIELPAGEFIMGSDTGMPNERPARSMQMDAFLLDRSPVTVSQYRRWVKSTGYKTAAEQFGDSGVFNTVKGEWQMIKGANWRFPQGPDAGEAPSDHPVTQVSFADAMQFCEASGGRLPTEFEFEYAAKGAGQYGDPVYAFGDTIKKDDDYLVNVFNGEFPLNNTGEDGYIYTAPVGLTGITPLGLTDMAGNVWEWSASWYTNQRREKTLRGGSFLCDEDVCHGYRTTARSQTTPETSLAHIGFRCAYDIDGG